MRRMLETTTMLDDHRERRMLETKAMLDDHRERDVALANLQSRQSRSTYSSNATNARCIVCAEQDKRMIHARGQSSWRNFVRMHLPACKKQYCALRYTSKTLHDSMCNNIRNAPDADEAALHNFILSLATGMK